MGLTIHYSLKAQGCDARARQLVTALHQAALDLPFKEVGDILDLSGDACDYKQRRQKNQLCWSLCEATCTVSLKPWQRLVADQPEEISFAVAPSRIIGFNAWPGEGCEEANFGLCQYPATFAHPRLGRVKTKLAGWHWRSFCKTQYASNPGCGGVANFLRCHLTVIAMLDQAKVLGCLAEVWDEGKFWEQRDVTALANGVGSWNEMIAAAVGQLKDVLGDRVLSAISEYPNVEHLEAAGQNQLTPETERLAQLIKQVLAAREVAP